MGLLVMVKSDIEYFDLRNDGNIVLYLGSTKNPNYQIRLKLPNTKNYIRKSTQTNNFEVGKKFGLELYEELNFRIRSGEKIDSPTYQKIFEEWKKYKICVLIEPTTELYDDNNLSENLAKRFQTRRGYTSNLLRKLNDLAASKKINLQKVKRLKFGSLMMEGYNFFVWSKSS